MTFSGFSKDFFGFFEELAENNNREWFQANKTRYEGVVVQSCLDFITAMAPELKKVSPHFDAIPKKTGGSMFRIYRDTRFSKDKTPYKTNAGIHFRHALGKDAHAPGFYVHLAPGSVWYGCGMWMPPSDALKKIRTTIDQDQAGWKKVKNGKAFKSAFGGLAEGNPLSRPPKGYDPDHPLLEDLKKRGFTVGAESSEVAAGKPGFVKEVGKGYKAASPLVKFLCNAVDASF